MLKTDKELFQWEKGRFVTVERADITIVEFYNNKSETSDGIDVVDGKAKIPNKLLEQSLPITALACVNDGDNGTKVITRKTFKVHARPKPNKYEEDEPDIPGPDDPSSPDLIIYDGGVIV